MNQPSIDTKIYLTVSHFSITCFGSYVQSHFLVIDFRCCCKLTSRKLCKTSKFYIKNGFGITLTIQLPPIIQHVLSKHFKIVSKACTAHDSLCLVFFSSLPYTERHCKKYILVLSSNDGCGVYWPHFLCRLRRNLKQK